MEFLFSNYPPMKTGCKTFADTFYGLLPQTTKLDIAVGYVSSDALIELQKTIELNSNIRTLNLIVGMHYFDHFTKVQYDTAMNLNDFLVRNQLGGVRLVNALESRSPRLGSTPKRALYPQRYQQQPTNS